MIFSYHPFNLTIWSFVQFLISSIDFLLSFGLVDPFYYFLIFKLITFIYFAFLPFCFLLLWVYSFGLILHCLFNTLIFKVLIVDFESSPPPIYWFRLLLLYSILLLCSSEYFLIILLISSLKLILEISAYGFSW